MGKTHTIEEKGLKAKAQKAAAQAAKENAAAAEREREEAASWREGANNKKALKEAEAARAAAEKAAKKAELDALAKAEEAEIAAMKGKKTDKVAARKAKEVNDLSEALSKLESQITHEARNIDSAIDVLNVNKDTTEEFDAHPEKRMKASFAAFRERELVLLKKEYPTLRLSQLNDMLKRNWDKSPDNPMVQQERLKQKEASKWKENA